MLTVFQSLQPGVQNTLESRMPDVKQAVGYQQISAHFQRQDGKRFLEDARPCPGDSILDLGCGTGELSAYLAQLAGQEGKVVAVDPDVDRIQVALKSHTSVKNLVFLEGSASNFPRMGTEAYDIIFCNYVLHWIPDKEELFKNMFSSLKPTGKIALQYSDHMPTLYDHAYRELNPENITRIIDMHYFESRSGVENICKAAGFDIVKSYDVKRSDHQFENGESIRKYFWATTHGVFDPQLVTEDRLATFCDRYSIGGGAPFRFLGEGDFHSALIAAKPAKPVIAG